MVPGADQTELLGSEADHANGALDLALQGRQGASGFHAGDCASAIIAGSLGDVIAGAIPGRESNHEITLFKSVGLAVQDISTALHVFNKAAETGVGKEFSFF